MSEEYSLKKSEAGIGQLYPILEAKDGEIIDGFHRQESNKNWKRVRLENIDTEEKKLTARLVANFHRRIVGREEKEQWINELAEIYKKQGLRIQCEYGNEISKKIMDITGLSQPTISRYLDRKYKQKDKVLHTDSSYQLPASERIEHDLGKEYVERHREEVLAEEKPKIEREVKSKLLKSLEFQREFLNEISKPKIIKPNEACPSGICELPLAIEDKKPIDVVSESIKLFFENNPDCLCKGCMHYGTCGVIR